MGFRSFPPYLIQVRPELRDSMAGHSVRMRLLGPEVLGLSRVPREDLARPPNARLGLERRHLGSWAHRPQARHVLPPGPCPAPAPPMAKGVKWQAAPNTRLQGVGDIAVKSYAALSTGDFRT